MIKGLIFFSLIIFFCLFSVSADLQIIGNDISRIVNLGTVAVAGGTGITDNTNIAYLNNTQVFTGLNSFNNNVSMTGDNLIMSNGRLYLNNAENPTYFTSSNASQQIDLIVNNVIKLRLTATTFNVLSNTIVNAQGLEGAGTPESINITDPLWFTVDIPAWFRDDDLNISSPADGQLRINADSNLIINSPIINLSAIPENTPGILTDFYVCIHPNNTIFKSTAVCR